jgi:fatty acid kinase fatty acid binding subunit
MRSSARSATRPGAVLLSAENTAVVLDSTADLPDPAGRHPNWRLVPLYVRFGDETFREYADLSSEEFYQRLRESPEQPKSSQPSPADFQAAFESLSGYEKVLCVVLSAKISGTYESARLAAENAEDGRVRVIDSGVTSGGTVILADAIQRRLERGADDAEIDSLVERFRRERGLLFTVDTLEYLIRGGRIGKAAGLAGQLLSVKPILVFDDGEVAPFKRVRGRGKAIAELESIFVAGTEDSPNLHVGVGHAEAKGDAEELVGRVQSARPSASLDIVTTLGPVIGTHGGPGTLGLFWFQDDV